MCKFDWAISLVLADASRSYELRLEGDLKLRLDGRDHAISSGPDPTSGAAVLGLLHRSVQWMEAFKDGRLVVTFGGDAVLNADAGTEYEAWELTGPSGVRIVSLPDGALAVWSPTDG